MSPIEFDAQAYTLKIDQLKRASEALDKGKNLDTQLSDTSLGNIKELCQAIDKWQKLLQDYHQSLQMEVSKLTKVGTDLVKVDQQLARKIDSELQTK